jgi:hypothetical protein
MAVPNANPAFAVALGSLDFHISRMTELGSSFCSWRMAPKKQKAARPVRGRCGLRGVYLALVVSDVNEKALVATAT